MESITVLLNDWARGDEAALERLTPLVYPELQALARAYLRRGARPVTLQTTAVVNELFVRLLASRPPQLDDRRHFYVLAARIIRTGLSKATVDRKVRLARAWLFQRLRPSIAS